MTDKELLKLAAKAAGRPEKPDAPEEGSLEFLLEPYGTWADEGWNPLADDGDALRLAVKLGLLVSVQHEELLGNVEVHIFPSGRPQGKFISEPLGTDPYAATRRAIVRAAAEIGKELK